MIIHKKDIRWKILKQPRDYKSCSSNVFDIQINNVDVFIEVWLKNNFKLPSIIFNFDHTKDKSVYILRWLNKNTNLIDYYKKGRPVKVVYTNWFNSI